MQAGGIARARQQLDDVRVLSRSEAHARARVAPQPTERRARRRRVAVHEARVALRSPSRHGVRLATARALHPAARRRTTRHPRPRTAGGASRRTLSCRNASASATAGGATYAVSRQIAGRRRTGGRVSRGRGRDAVHATPPPPRRPRRPARPGSARGRTRSRAAPACSTTAPRATGCKEGSPRCASPSRSGRGTRSPCSRAASRAAARAAGATTPRPRRAARPARGTRSCRRRRAGPAGPHLGARAPPSS